MPHLAPLKSANHFQQLAHAIFEKDRELTDRRIIPSPHGRETGSRAFADAHQICLSLQGCQPSDAVTA